MSDIVTEELFTKFKQVFIAEKNCGYLLQLLQQKLGYRLSSQQSQEILIPLQQAIYDNLFISICNEMGKRGKLNLEEVLTTLNKITLSRLEELINSNQHSSNSNTSQDTHSSKKGDVICKNLHVFSNDCKLENGRYFFPFQLENLKTISILAFTLDCNIYNITEFDNKFNIIERNTQFVTTIPIGYYQIDELFDMLSDITSENSPHNFKYVFFRNKNKNKTYLECFSNDGKPQTFNFSASPTFTNMLGFVKNEYANNNIYVSENHPVLNILDTLFIKLYVNNTDIPKVHTLRNFSYFHCFHVDLNTDFGKQKNLTTYNSHDFFDFNEAIDVKDVSIELWTSTSRILTRFVNFDITLSFECLTI